jgi:alanine racemase
MLPLKPHTWIELSQSAFAHNIGQYAQLINGRGDLAVVVKSNAYGHGMEQIAGLCQADPRVGWLCVAHLSEALTLRHKFGITKPILVLAVVDEDPREAIINDITLTIYDKEMLTELNDYLKNNGGGQVKVHLKIDTGMSRFGFFMHEVEATAQYVRSLAHILPTGMYTHSAESGSRDLLFAREQMNLFAKAREIVQKILPTVTYVHATNSGATIGLINDYPFFNLFRVGAGAYGFWHSQESRELAQALPQPMTLKTVLSWKTRIMSLKTISKGAYVGYDQTYQAPGTVTLGMLPVGYYESYDRKLYTVDRYAYVNDQLAPVVARTCMNVMTLNVTHLPQTKVGDIVELVGDKPHISAYELAALINSGNAREVTSRLAPLLPRILVP